jgi:hypothetical protein
MTERAPGSIAVTSLRVGRTDVGAAAAVVNDDALVLAVCIESEERSLRLRFASIDSVHVSGDEIDLVVRDGTHVVIVAPTELRDAVLDRCRSLPELTRTLRAFGSSRARRSGPGGRTTDADEQRRFFDPFLDARRATGAGVQAGGQEAIAAFNGTALADALTRTLSEFAADRQPSPGPARRALEAELVDAAEPLFDALTALRQAADAALATTEDLRLWRAWSNQLRATFETADRVWMALDEALDAAHRRAVAEESRTAKAGRLRR